MTTVRQIAANRRNARKSTGPQTPGAKKRTSGNALRHGLATSYAANPAEAAMIGQLTEQIAGSRKERLALALARDAAVAQFDLARVRWVKAELIGQVVAFGSIDPPEIFSSAKDEWRYIRPRCETTTRGCLCQYRQIRRKPCRPTLQNVWLRRSDGRCAN
ncbi:hypothetical protein [Bradyrhizobium sp. 169]|uniref:hypothetical protein n=1 Tax=Bradyrhizobium sp. 169 TaxID=2782640 RepID=UPI001FF99D05|nr:hypothetical protein [Bradyrhizobium sp. 169]MCK1589254.1 hypothetical protein [Bradyrhizobium sp. 169]